MNRRSVFTGALAVVKAVLFSSFAVAAQAATQRIAGPQWNVNGDWTPSAEALQSHLRNAHGIDPTGLGLEEMLTMHDNDHNRMGYRHGHSAQKSPKASTRGYRKF